MPYLRFATGDRLRLDGEEMPGVVVALEVEGENSVESLPREGKAGDVHVLRGYRDFRVRITLRLAGPDPLAEARALQAKFAKSKTEPLRVVHPHLAARGVEKALFARLTTREEGGEEGVYAVLELVQTEPREALKEGNAAEAAALGQALAGARPVAGPPKGSAQAARNPSSPPKPPAYLEAFLQGRQAGLALGGGQ
ncbi:hypothetical protein [Thermus sp.]|uniref:hypothetical protein n=1 Tax=Thermus sp. TaxID=275 RepID=UPI00298EE82C|nr:hypothetical protein [Thermus sp.]MDW8358812.1 hypothetical protein [Thermus sp.]